MNKSKGERKLTDREKLRQEFGKSRRLTQENQQQWNATAGETKALISDIKENKAVAGGCAVVLLLIVGFLFLFGPFKQSNEGERIVTPTALAISAANPISEKQPTRPPLPTLPPTTELLVPSPTPEPPTPEPPTAEPPTPVPAVAATPAPPEPPQATLNIVSNGLGATREAWEKEHYAPIKEGLVAYYGGTSTSDHLFEIGFVTPDSYSADGTRIWWITRYFRLMPATYEGASKVARDLIPADSQQTSHKQETDEQGVKFIIDAYYSDSLSKMLKPNPPPPPNDLDLWEGEKPGTFFILYTAYPDMEYKIPSFDIRLGHVD